MHPSLKRIAFSIEPEKTVESNSLVISLGERQPTGELVHTEAKQPRSYWLSLARENEEKQALAALLEEYQSTVPVKSISIPAHRAVAILKLLSAAGSLYCKNNQLVVDLYGAAAFYYAGTVVPENGLELKGCLKWREQPFLLEECICVGPGRPLWFIKGITLRFLSTVMTWKELKHAFLNQNWVVRDLEKNQFLDALSEADADTPRLIFQRGSLEEANRQADPLPRLILTERTGAFANLWMDYGADCSVLFHEHSPSVKDAKGNSLFKRKMEVEKAWERDLIETGFIQKQMDTSRYYCPLHQVGKSLAFLLDLGWTLLDWKGNRLVKWSRVQLHMEEQGREIALKGKVRFGSFEANLSQLTGAFNRRERFVEIGAGQVGLLPERASGQADWDALADLIEEGESVGDTVKISKSRFGLLEALWPQVDSSSKLAELKAMRGSFTSIRDVMPAPDFLGELRPYQREGLNWLHFLYISGFNGILADDMGLGKTVQILAFLSLASREQPHLIVMPTSLIFNWRNELLRFLPALSCYVHQGPGRKKAFAELPRTGVILTTYATLRLDASLFQGCFFESVILDEAQMVKNAHTQIAQVVTLLKSRFKLSVTGTPVENHLKELWSHFRFLMPDLFGPEQEFDAALSAALLDKRHLDKIKKKAHPFILRRTKAQVLQDLPARIDQLVWIEMGEEQRAVYDQFLAGFKGNLLKKVAVEGTKKCRMEILEAILRLRQICCHPLLVASTSGSAKFEACLADLETIIEEKKKVLIYSQFTSLLKLLTEEAKKRGWKFAYLDGSTTNREQVVASFQEDPAQQLFFISLRAGGVGLNLTAADYVLLYDPWWNEAVENQAIDRAHRIGRRDVVIAKRYATVETIEEKMMRLKAIKRETVEQIFGEGMHPFELTVEDLDYLLS